jgi:hypothetical protein
MIDQLSRVSFTHHESSDKIMKHLQGTTGIDTTSFTLIKKVEVEDRNPLLA